MARASPPCLRPVVPQDMLLIGNSCINDDEGRTQMAIWSIYAAPLIMGAIPSRRPALSIDGMPPHRPLPGALLVPLCPLTPSSQPVALCPGNDIRNISQSSTDILTNKDAIAVNQDPLGQQGGRISAKGDTEIWARHLENGDVAVAL